MNFKLRILPRLNGMCSKSLITSASGRLPERSPGGRPFTKRPAVLPVPHMRTRIAAEQLISSFELRQFLFKTRRGRTYRGVFAVVNHEVRIVRVRGPGQGPLTDNELSNE